MNDVREPEVRVLYRGESAVVYCIDMQDEPEVAAGAAISLPQVAIIDGSGTLVSFGAPSVTAADFVQKDRDGNVEKTVPAGKGIKFAATPGATKGACTALVSALESLGNSRIGKPVQFQVK